MVDVVALFRDNSKEEVREVLRTVRPTLLQFHGDETPEFCQQFGMPWIKAVRMRQDINLWQVKEDYHLGQGLLLDAYQKGTPGGTGASFDWQRIPRELAPEIILAGGLDATNIQQAVAQVQPWAVDVSGGVESSKGIKDHVKIDTFMAEIRTTY